MVFKKLRNASQAERPEAPAEHSWKKHRFSPWNFAFESENNIQHASGCWMAIFTWTKDAKPFRFLLLGTCLRDDLFSEPNMRCRGEMLSDQFLGIRVLTGHQNPVTEGQWSGCWVAYDFDSFRFNNDHLSMLRFLQVFLLKTFQLLNLLKNSIQNFKLQLVFFQISLIFHFLPARCTSPHKLRSLCTSRCSSWCTS